jgi:hypothetical protein
VAFAPREIADPYIKRRLPIEINDLFRIMKSGRLTPLA